MWRPPQPDSIGGLGISDAPHDPTWFKATDGKWYPPVPPQPPPPPPPPPAPAQQPGPGLDRLLVTALMVGGGGAALIAGSAMPWATVTAGFFSVSKSGLDGGDGIFSIAIGVVIAALGWPLYTHRHLGRPLAWAIVAMAILGGVLFSREVSDLDSRRDEANGHNAATGIDVQVEPGIGLYAIAGGSGLALIAGFMEVTEAGEAATRPRWKSDGPQQPG